MSGTPPLIALADVTRSFALRRRAVQLPGMAPAPRLVAVDGVSLAIAAGETVGLVGESGCGKSTLGRLAAGHLAPDRGEVRFQGRAIDRLGVRERRDFALRTQMIFQDPLASLNPRLRVGIAIGEAPVYHRLVPRTAVRAHVAGLLRRVGLDPAIAERFPHQLSGGQRQRIGIARALAVRPLTLICDEPVAALDVSIQAQILNLLLELRCELGLTCLFISHDLGVVRHLADRVLVMYLGAIVEAAPTEALFQRTNHPYSRALLAAMPRLAAGRQAFTPIAGEIPSPLKPPAGCRFHPRCPQAMARCRAEAPALKPIAPGHLAACHLNDGG